MQIIEDNNKIILSGVTDFDLTDTFDCGQCFRFNKAENGNFIGVAYGKVIELEKKNDDIIIYNTNIDDFNNIWRDFLDLDRNYTVIKEKLMLDDVLKETIRYGGGIRILKQDFFECLISFIISQQNAIPKIKKAVDAFAEKFGKPTIYKGVAYYAFPTAGDLSDIEISDLNFLRIGYRDKYIIDAIKKVNSGEINYKKIAALPYLQAKEELLKIHGVGQKVADCVLLFSFLMFDSFPVDTWIKRAMSSLYSLEVGEIHKYTAKNFGNLSGFAQQYIFYYIRNKKAK